MVHLFMNVEITQKKESLINIHYKDLHFSMTLKNHRVQPTKLIETPFLNLDEPDIFHQKISPPPGMLASEFVDLIRINAKLYKAQAYWPYGPNSNSAADFPLYRSGIDTEAIPGALGLHHYHKTGALNDILNDTVKLIYSYGQDKLQGLISQIKSEVISSGSFKDLNIGDNKTAVISGLRKMKAYYVSTQSNSAGDAHSSASNGMINLHPDSNDGETRLYASDTWNVTYDSEGETFWFLQLDFSDNKLSEVNVKSSSLELP